MCYTKVQSVKDMFKGEEEEYGVCWIFNGQMFKLPNVFYFMSLSAWETETFKTLAPKDVSDDKWLC